MPEKNWTPYNLIDLGEVVNELLLYVQNVLRLKEAQTRKLQERLWRFSAHIRQPRKNDRSCNRTPFFDRWDTNTRTSHLTITDPRYAPIEDCKQIYRKLLALILEADRIPEVPHQAIIVERTLGRPFQSNSLTCVHTGQPISGTDIKRALAYSTSGLGSYEIPISYHTELDAGGRHEHTNVGWMKPLHVNYKLRTVLRSHLAASGAQRKAIKNALDKIVVKSYCTDKQTMPPHFSNRDVRWATWPDSVQYASHHQCAMVEMELIAQLYEFR